MGRKSKKGHHGSGFDDYDDYDDYEEFYNDASELKDLSWDMDSSDWEAGTGPRQRKSSHRRTGQRRAKRKPYSELNEWESFGADDGANDNWYMQ